MWSIKEQKSGRRCYNCSKSFRDPSDLRRHKNRKTPCLIRNINEENKLDPRRCIYCNRIFTSISNRNKHYKICRVKNGGINILYEKIKHSEELEKENDKIKQENDDLEQKYEQSEQRNEELEKQIIELKLYIINDCKNNSNNDNNTQGGADEEKFDQIYIPEITDRKGYIYIATTLTYEQKNIYKIGRTHNLKNRLVNYNTGRPNNDRMEYKYSIKCYDVKTAEAGLKVMLEFCNLVKGTEMYKLPFDHLKETIELYCTNLNKTIEEFRDISKKKVNTNIEESSQNE
jgi:hypothetical protein